MQNLLSKLMEADIFKPATPEDVETRKEHDRKFQDPVMQRFYRQLRQEGMEEQAAVDEVTRQYARYDNNEAKVNEAEDIFKPASDADMDQRDLDRKGYIQKRLPWFNLDDYDYLEGVCYDYTPDVVDLIEFYYDLGKKAGQSGR